MEQRTNDSREVSHVCNACACATLDIFYAVVRDVLRGAVLVTADISAGHQVHTFEVNSRVGPLCFVVKSPCDLNLQIQTSSFIHIITKLSAKLSWDTGILDGISDILVSW